MTNLQLKTLIKSCIKTLLNEGLLGLTKKDLDEIVHIQFIHGTSEEENIKRIRSVKQLIYRLIRTRYPWMLEYQYSSRREGSIGNWYAPFAKFFIHEHEHEYEDWLHDFCREIIEQRSLHQHNDVLNTENIPNFDEDLKEVYEYASRLTFQYATNPLNPKNYPVYVSLYTSSREYGGPEDGGWHFIWKQFHKSIKVNNLNEARKATVQLLKDPIVHQYSIGVNIYLEKVEKSLQTKERPHYS